METMKQQFNEQSRLLTIIHLFYILKQHDGERREMSENATYVFSVTRSLKMRTTFLLLVKT